MASVLDLGLINQFSSIFAILFIFLVTFAILEVTQVLKQNHGVHGLIALIVALLSATSPDALGVITNIAPFFVIVLIFLVFLFLAALFAGFEKVDVFNVIGGRQSGAVWLILISVIILFFGLSNVYGQSFLQFSTGQVSQSGSAVVANATSTNTNTGSFSNNLANTIFNPKILGMILIMLIGAFAVALLTSGPHI